MIKTAFDIIEESFEKIAGEFSKEEKAKIKALKRDINRASRSANTPKDIMKGYASILGGGAAGFGLGLAANKLSKGRLQNASSLLGAVGAHAALVPVMRKSSKRSEMAIDNLLQYKGYDLSKLKNERKSFKDKMLKPTYKSITSKGVAKRAIRSEREKTAFDIVNESFEKQAGMIGMAKGLMTATKALGKNSKNLVIGLGGMLNKGRNFKEITSNRGFQNAAKNIGKGLVLPGAGLMGANYALNKLSPKKQQPNHLNY